MRNREITVRAITSRKVIECRDVDTGEFAQFTVEQFLPQYNAMNIAGVTRSFKDLESNNFKWAA